MLVADQNATSTAEPAAPRHTPADDDTVDDSRGEFRLFGTGSFVNVSGDDSGNESDGQRGVAPAASPPVPRWHPDARSSGGNDRGEVPKSNSREKLESRPGHAPQVEATLSDYQAVLIAKISADRGDKERADLEAEYNFANS